MAQYPEIQSGAGTVRWAVELELPGGQAFGVQHEGGVQLDAGVLVLWTAANEFVEAYSPHAWRRVRRL